MGGAGRLAIAGPAVALGVAASVAGTAAAVAVAASTPVVVVDVARQRTTIGHLGPSQPTNRRPPPIDSSQLPLRSTTQNNKL